MELSKEEKRIVEMFDSHLSISEIAEKLGKTIKETKLIFRNICKKLAGKID